MRKIKPRDVKKVMRLIFTLIPIVIKVKKY